MAPPVIIPSTARTCTESHDTVTSTTWSSRVKLKPTRYYPPMPFHIFPEDHFYLTSGQEYASNAGSVSPLAVQIIGVIAVGLVLSIILCCTRYHTKRRLRKYQIKGDMSEKRPSWTKCTPVITASNFNVSWNRRNIGRHVTQTSSRCIYVNLQEKFAASARPNAQGHRLANSHDITMVFEGAMSDVGFSRGRHIFAFMWPRDQRYANEAYLAFGLGYPSLELRGNDEVILGASRKSMAFDVIKNELYFNFAKIGKYPRRRGKDFCVPTLFYMYADLDEGRLSFSSETEYWGTAFNFSNMRKNPSKPLHVMASFRAIKGKIMMFYKGSVTDKLQTKTTDKNNSTTSDDSGIECHQDQHKKEEDGCNKKPNKQSEAHPYTFLNHAFQHDYDQGNCDTLPLDTKCTNLDNPTKDKSNMIENDEPEKRTFSLLKENSHENKASSTDLSDVMPHI